MNMPLSTLALGQSTLWPATAWAADLTIYQKALSFESAIPALVTHTKGKNGDGQRYIFGSKNVHHSKGKPENQPQGTGHTDYI